MVTHSIEQLSVALNAKSAEQFAGSALDTAPMTGLLEIRCAAAARGIRATLYVGQEVIVDDVPISNANRWPIRPDDVLATVGVAQGEDLRLFFRNTTGAAILLDAVAELA